MGIEQTIEEQASKARAAMERGQFLYDLVFVLNINSKGWILEKVCKKIEEQSGLHCGWIYSERNDRLTEDLPQAHAYFFAHYQIACHTLAKYPQVWSAKRFVYFTHPDFTRGLTPNEVLKGLSNMHQIFCMNTAHKLFLCTLGIPDDRITIAVGGADPDAFTVPRSTGKGVGFIGAYYQRKNPDLVLDTIKALPKKQFYLIAPSEDEIVNPGMSWRNFSRFDELSAQPNLEYIESPYANYPEVYNRLEYYVSLSHLEGGPISLLETMLSGIYPIVTDTGFARDVITDTTFGTVLPIDCTVHDVTEAIATKVRSRTKLRERAMKFSWENFGVLVTRKMELALVQDQHVSFTNRNPCPALISGWWPPEQHGVWSAADKSTIYFPLARKLRGAAFDLNMHVWTLPGIKQTLKVTINGEPQPDVDIESANPCTLNFSIGAEVSSSGYLAVTISPGGLHQPKAIGLNQDERILGFKLGSLRVSN